MSDAEKTPCSFCSGSLSVPSLDGDYESCPSCVIDAGETWVVLDDFADLDDGEEVTVYCCRCPLEQGLWRSLVSEVASSVERHAHEVHAGAPGLTRPDGSPVWVPGDDWWLVDEQELRSALGRWNKRDD